MRGLDEFVKSSLTEPVEVRRSKRDQSVHLHYGRFKVKLVVCTVVKFFKWGRLRNYGLLDQKDDR